MRSLLLLPVFLFCSIVLYAQPWAQLMKDAWPGSIGGTIASGGAAEPTALNNTVYYAACDGSNGTELWATDGTPANTRMVKDINPNAFSSPGPAGSSYPSQFMAVNGRMIFKARKSDTSYYTLWVTDGTASGTVELNGGLRVSTIFMPMGRYAYFMSEDGYMFNLWRTDGTAAGTTSVGYNYTKDTSDHDQIACYAVANNGLYYAFDFTTEWIFYTDGTHTGIGNHPPVNAQKMVNFQNAIYFIGGRKKLYKDNNTGGATLISSLNTVNASILYFEATPTQIVMVDASSAIWTSDGTTAGTKKLTDMLGCMSPVLVGNKLYTITAPSKSYNHVLGITDLNTGTTTFPDTTILIGSHNLLPDNTFKELLTFQGKFYFEGQKLTIDQLGNKHYGKRSLYIYDINSNTMKPVPNISTVHTNFDGANIGNQIFLCANDSVTGQELWKITDIPAVVSDVFDKSGFIIYPNPAHSELHLRSSYSSATYKVFNTYGQTLMQGIMYQDMVLSVGQLPSGIYNISVSADDGTLFTRQFIKQ